MKQFLPLLLFLGSLMSSFAQLDYGTPQREPLPDKIKNLRQAIDVVHFPKEIDAIKINETYYWKHITSIMSKESQIEILEYGAYIFYNGTWNLRQKYPLKELNRNFGTKKQVLNQAEPYTWVNNYRIGTELYGGWALWYFIGETASGETVCGYATVNTTNNLLN